VAQQLICFKQMNEAPSDETRPLLKNMNKIAILIIRNASGT
jgi:hypothetical protein